MSERNGNGQFGIGNPGGPGRPPRTTEETYLRAMRDVVTLEEWEAIVRRAVQQAKQGNSAAHNWISRHLCPLATRHKSAPRATPPGVEKFSEDEVRLLMAAMPREPDREADAG